jgi:hypothetical protein
MRQFFIAWTSPEGERDHGAIAASEDLARVLAGVLNEGCGDLGAHVVVPEEHIESWKAGTWTPS